MVGSRVEEARGEENAEVVISRLLPDGTPGRKAMPPGGSGFISCDNDDPTATNMWTLLNEAGIDRGSDYVAWNVVPWYIGTETGVLLA